MVLIFARGSLIIDLKRGYLLTSRFLRAPLPEQPYVQRETYQSKGFLIEEIISLPEPISLSGAATCFPWTFRLRAWRAEFQYGYIRSFASGYKLIALTETLCYPARGSEPNSSMGSHHGKFHIP